MATTSIWSVKGWIGKVVIYVENPDKTTNPKFFERKDMSEKQAEGLLDVIDYATDPQKTNAKIDDESIETQSQFVTGINCLPMTARAEMIAVKKRYGKNEGIVAYHGYQSFAPGETNPKLAHEIGVRLAQRLWGDKYQVIVATHLDKENHLHNHFVVNNVSFVDGIKYHRTEKDYYNMQKISDELCREYGLSVIEAPQHGRTKPYGEWKAEQEMRPTWRGMIRSDIDAAIRSSFTEKQFFRYLQDKGYEVKIGKDISVRPCGKERFVRLKRNFGDEYSIENIRKRILLQATSKKDTVDCRYNTKIFNYKGSFNKLRKITGFRALYLHYCYKLGIFPKERNRNPARLHFLLREDLIKLNNISKEVKLLVRNRIDTAEQLSLYKNGLEVKLYDLIEERKALHDKMRTNTVRDNPDAKQSINTKIDCINEQLRQLRCEIHLCDDIAVRSEVISQKLKTVRRAEHTAKVKTQEKEKEISKK